MTQPLTVADVIREYLVAKTGQMQAGLVHKRTCIKAHFYCLAFAEDFGQLRVEQCRRGDLKRWLVKHPEYESPHTKHDACAQIVAAFRWAEEDGLISSCPYRKPKDLPAPEPRQPITGPEVRAILASAHGYGHRPTRRAFRLALWFLWQTGCRTCELYRLDWSQYDDSRGCFELRSKTTAKTGRLRLLALPRKAWRLIRWLRARQTGITGPVFRNGRGRPWNKDSFGKLFRRHANAAGVREEVSAYCLRHGFTVEALEAGAGERQLADYLGHSTTRYVGWYGRGVRSKVDYLREVGERRKE